MLTAPVGQRACFQIIYFKQSINKSMNQPEASVSSLCQIPVVLAPSIFQHVFFSTFGSREFEQFTTFYEKCVLVQKIFAS